MDWTACRPTILDCLPLTLKVFPCLVRFLARLPLAWVQQPCAHSPRLPPPQTATPAATPRSPAGRLATRPIPTISQTQKKEHDYEPDNEKHSYVWLVNAEKQFDEHQLAGLALFSNSFGQFTQYAYYGWQFRPFDSAPQLFFKITGGVIHGYKYPYHKKIPLNNKNGWGFTAIPAVGWNFNQNWGAQVNVLGNSAMMFQLNYTMR